MVAWSFGIIQPLFKNQNCCFFKNHKKSKLCHKVIIIISLESSYVTLLTVHLFFFFPFYCRVIWIFVKSFKKNSKKIMKSDMGILSVSQALCGPSTSTPDKQLNRQVFYFILFFFE